ncbi:MAG: ATP-binding cassette domain-containing protein, partial [Sphingobacteriales bacterium]
MRRLRYPEQGGRLWTLLLSMFLRPDLMISVLGSSKSFGTVVSVAGFDLTVQRGELLVLLGGSGSGKTTCLKMVNRLIEPDSGDVIVAGRNVRSMAPHLLRRSIGYCFQRVGL